MEASERFRQAFERGVSERNRCADTLQHGLEHLRQALETSGLELVIEPSDYNGIFIRPTKAEQPTGKTPGWWSYIIVNTQPLGLNFTVHAGFGLKNDPDHLRDAWPSKTVDHPETALKTLEEAIAAGLYYLGTLRH